jgi:hypothetical protein
MQYVVTIKEKRLKEQDLVFIIFDSEEVLSLPGVLTTDGNAASEETRFWIGKGALSSIDWEIINTPNCYSKIYKRKKCAEVLIPHELPAVLIKRICVMSTDAKTTLEAELLRVAQIARQYGIPMRSIKPEVVKELFYLQDALMDEILARLIEP